MANDQTPYAPPPVQDRSSRPPGILPRNAQRIVMGVVSILMIMVFALTGRNTPRGQAPHAPTTTSSVVDPNEARIREYRTRIEEQARKLASEQARLIHPDPILDGSVPAAPAVAPRTPYAGRTCMAEERPGYSLSSTAQGQGSGFQAANRERDPLLASNVVLSYRKNVSGAGVGSTQGSSQNSQIRASETSGEEIQSSKDRKRESDGDLNAADGKEYRLFEGTVIETVLTNRLDGSFSGPVNTMVTTNVYSRNRQQLLIPQGSRVLGEVRKVDTYGDTRLAVVFHRLIMPDGYALNLDKIQGLNQIGETGLADQVNHHYLQVFGVSLAVGAIAGLSQANTRYGSDASAADAYRQGAASSLSQTSLHILDRYLNVLPTFTIREGHRVKVYLTEDLRLPAYRNHRMPNDL
jgi:type IV secretory pathway VirB10-like protein